MEIFQAMIAAFLVLLTGDFISTFFYHVPEHVFGKFHVVVHHSKKPSFIRYAIRTKNHLALVSGFLAAFAYFIPIAWLWNLSPMGAILGLLLAESHVVWRHVPLCECPTAPIIADWCDRFCITTPERHQQHHENGNIAYGDIFTFYDRPAQIWLQFLRKMKQKLKRWQRSNFRWYHIF